MFTVQLCHEINEFFLDLLVQVVVNMVQSLTLALLA